VYIPVRKNNGKITTRLTTEGETGGPNPTTPTG